jgi:hypothetical protein
VVPPAYKTMSEKSDASTGRTYCVNLASNVQNSQLKKLKLPKSQSLLQMSLEKTVEDTSSNQTGFIRYDPDNVRNLIIQYFIKSELPFRHVESEGFTELINGIEPRFKIPCRITLQKDCMKVYEQEKLRLKVFLSGQRVCITINTWTSLQNLKYMCVTAHFIDCDWIMHKKILKFGLISNHSDETIGRMLESTLIEWRIDNVFTITVDDASTNDVGIDYMKKRMKDKSSIVLGGKFLYMRCAAHILNLIVNDGLKDLSDCISNIRNAVRYVRSSPARMSKFKDCIKCKNIQCTKMMCLDVPTRWYSTYLMLSIAEKYQKAFDLLGEDENNQFVVPRIIDWKNTRAFVKFLKIFYDATLKFSGSTYATSNSYLMQLCIIQRTLNDGCLSSDPIMSSVSFNMKSKCEKYWGTMDKINLMLYVAFVLDPRFKIKGLVFFLRKCNEPVWADQIETNVRDLMNHLIEQYSTFHGGESSNFDADVGSSHATLNVVGNELEDSEAQYMEIFYQHLVEENDLECRSEVDRYLLDGYVATTKDFDILAWWKVNAPKYPILAEIARDVLAIPISTGTSESAFNTGGRILDPFMSSLSPLTVEALICTQNWLMNRPINFRELEEFVGSYDE